jgi:hypothetical protein
MELTHDERDLLLAGLYELSLTHAQDDAKRERIKILVDRLGGDTTALFFAVQLDDETVALLEQLPALHDEPTGIYYPHATHGADDTEPKLARLLADCVTGGAHHLVTLDHPQEGMVVGCSHCHRYWRTD